MTRYNPMIVFPLFVLIVVIIGILYAGINESQFADHSLAQTRVADTITPKMTQSKQNQQKVQLDPPLTDLQFPDTQVISEATNSIRLESVADSTTITDWYKEKIRALGFTSKSFISANTNGNIEHRLMGTKAQDALYIEIKKPNGFIKTAINIEISKF